MKKGQRFRVLTLALLVLSVLFIWHNSMESAEVSQARSAALQALFDSIFLPLLGKDMFAQIELRKCAHFAEYFVYGAEMTLFLWAFSRLHFTSLVSCQGLCVMTALADETIQMFSAGRAAQVSDVLLDSGAALCGITVMLLVMLCAQAIKMTDERQEE